MNRFLPPAAAIALAVAPAMAGEGAPPAAETQDEPTPPGYRALRYEEDWTFLRDERRRKDIFDPLKYIPLDDAGDIYLTFGLDHRTQLEYYHNAFFGGAPPGEDTYVLFRFYPYADFHATRMFRAFFMLKSAFAVDTQLDPFPTQENRLDVHQAFADLALDTPVGRLTARPGRQELLYGSGRLIDNRSGPNAKISYDLVRGLFERPDDGLRIDGFFGKPVESEKLEFDDDPIGSVRVWGIYGTRPIGAWAGLDLYWLGISRRDHVFNEGTGDSVRHALGARFFAARGAGLDWNVEASGQVGTFDDGDILAWAGNADVGYTLDELPLKPRVGCRADVHSGDRHRGDGDLETFDPFFPRGILQGEAGNFGPANLVAFTPEIVLQPIDPVYVSARWSYYRRQSAGDGVYSLNTGLILPSDASDSKEIASELSITCDWYVGRHAILSAVYAYTWPGDFLRDAGLAEDQAFVSATLTFKF